MNRMELFSVLGQIEEDLLERSERHKGCRRRPWWTALVTLLIVCLLLWLCYPSEG